MIVHLFRRVKYRITSAESENDEKHQMRTRRPPQKITTIIFRIYVIKPFLSLYIFVEFVEKIETIKSRPASGSPSTLQIICHRQAYRNFECISFASFSLFSPFRSARRRCGYRLIVFLFFYEFSPRCMELGENNKNNNCFCFIFTVL